MRSPQALAEIAQFESRLLQDDPRSPLKRKVLYICDFGAVSRDGKDDWTAINEAVSAAHVLSKTLYEEYMVKVAAGTVPPLLNGTDDRPVFVELRFDPNGVYDLGKGMWLPQEKSYYVLLNGRNCTFVTHFESSFQNDQILPDPTKYYWWDTGMAFPCYDNWSPWQIYPRYILNFNFRTATPSLTMGRVTAVIRDINGKVTGFNMTAISKHYAFSTGDVIKFNHVDSSGKYQSLDEPYAQFNGWAGLVTYAQNEKLQGIMTISIQEADPETSNYLGSKVSVNDYYGLERGFQLRIGCGFSVAQGINVVGVGGWGIELGHFANGFDMIDVHQDRVTDALYVGNSGGPLGQVFMGGIHRLYHNSIEGGSDDNLNNMAPCSDIIAKNSTAKGLKMSVTNGRWTGSYGMKCPPVGSRIAFGRYPYVYNYIVNLTVTSCVTFEEASPAFSWIYFQESVAAVAINDVAFYLDGNPDLLHIKNNRAGNHIYNLFNIKAYKIIVEDSFMYNTTMGCVDISSDAGYWHEGNPVDTLIVQNNTFAGCFAAIQHVVYARDGIPPDSAHNVVVKGNYFFGNATTSRGDGWYPHVPIVLYAASNFTITNNTFSLVPGQRTDAPLMQFCNVRAGTISFNNVEQYTLKRGEIGGSACDRSTSVCPGYPGGSSVFYAKESDPSFGIGIPNTGCLTSRTSNIKFNCNNGFPNFPPYANSTAATCTP
jgi:hypothetical protein